MISFLLLQQNQIMYILLLIYIFRPDMIDHVRQDTTFLYYKLDIRSIN